MYNHQLDAFIATADQGSFSRAARQLFISTPALVQQINLLERKCGFSLFTRSNRGVVLTPAGRSLLEDARAIVSLSESALERARRVAREAGSTVRVGTALLYKCRRLPDLWVAIADACPDLTIQIVPMPEHSERGAALAHLGRSYDLFEGVYAATAFSPRCTFIELERTPVVCAVSPRHRLAGAARLTLEDLNGEDVILPVAGISPELDALRADLARRVPTAHITDSAYYGVDTFALCEVSPSVLISQAVYADIHPELVSIPLDTPIDLPYGLMCAPAPGPAAARFMDAVRAVIATG